jgi:hypothetical protein
MYKSILGKEALRDNVSINDVGARCIVKRWKEE